MVEVLSCPNGFRGNAKVVSLVAVPYGFLIEGEDPKMFRAICDVRLGQKKRGLKAPRAELGSFGEYLQTTRKLIL
jgi:hypothetical protein